MQKNLRYILELETAELSDGLDIGDDGKEGIKDDSQVSDLNSWQTEFLFTQMGEDEQIWVSRYHDFFSNFYVGHNKFSMSLTCLGDDVKKQSR